MAEESSCSPLPKGDPAEAECRTITFSTCSPRIFYTARYEHNVSAAQWFLSAQGMATVRIVPVVQLRSARRPDEEMRLTYVPLWFDQGPQGLYVILRCPRDQPHTPEAWMQEITLGFWEYDFMGKSCESRLQLYSDMVQLSPENAALTAEFFDTDRLARYACGVLNMIVYENLVAHHL
jgi:hypothetical protein